MRGRLSAVLARLAAAPGAVTVPVTNAGTGQQAPVPVLPETVAGIVFRLMYVREGVAVLPALIAALHRGVYRPLGTLLSQIGSEAPISLGMQLSVRCPALVARARPHARPGTLEGLAACGLRIVQAFIDAPGARPDARCAAEPVEFIAPEAALGAARRALRSTT